MHRYCKLPSFFTLLVVFNSLSLSKITPWARIEVHTLVSLGVGPQAHCWRSFYPSDLRSGHPYTI